MPERPPELRALLSATDATARDQAWEALVQRYTPVMLAAIHVSGHDRDLVMDAYAFVLEALRADDCRRLTRFCQDGRGAFTTWLTVVVRPCAGRCRSHPEPGPNPSPRARRLWT